MRGLIRMLCVSALSVSALFVPVRDARAEEALPRAGESFWDDAGEDAGMPGPGPEEGITAEIRMGGENESDGTYYYRADNCGIRVLFFGSPELLADGAWYAELDGRKETRRYAAGNGSDGILAAEYTVSETVSLLADGTHTVRAVCEGGNGGTEITDVLMNGVSESGSFVLDTTPPSAAWSVSSPASRRQERQETGGRYYFSADFSACAEIIEENAEEGSFRCFMGEIAEGEYDSSSAEVGFFETEIAGKKEGERVSFSDTRASDGVYRYRISGCDLAGNEVIFAGNLDGNGMSPHVVKDSVPPRGIASILENGSVCYRMDTDGSVIYAEPYRAADRLDVEFRCDTSVEHSPVCLLGKVAAGEAEHVVEESRYLYACSGIVSVSGGCRVRVEGFELEDLAGNHTVGKPSDTVYSDLAAPEIVSLYTTSEPSAGEGSLFGGDVSVRIRTRDPESGGSTGIGDVTVRVYEDGNERPSEEMLLHKGVKRAFEGNYEEEKKAAEFEKTFVIGRQHCSDRIDVRVTVSDNAGNTETSGISFGIDSEPPAARVVYENDPAGSGGFFGGDRQARVTVAERHFDADLFAVEAGGGEVSEWSVLQNGDRECVVRFTEEGEHTLSVFGTDTAGNEAVVSWEGEYAGRFVIDRTPPGILLRYEYRGEPEKREEAVPGETCFVREPSAVVVEVKDISFGGDTESLAVLIPEGEERETPAFSDSLLRIPFDEEGTYSVKGQVSDLAGNRSEILPETVWIVDRTPPSAEFSGAEEGTSLTEVPKLRIRVADANPDAGRIRISADGTRTGTRDLRFRTENQDGAVVCVPEMPEEDDFYHILCEASDPCGNSVRSELSFSLNRTGAVFTYLDPPEQNMVLSGPVRPAVRIEDVDPVRILSARINGSEADCRMEGDVLYPGDEITEDGKYVLTLSVKDTAGHVTEMEPLEFAVDRTPPSLRAEIEGGEKRRYTGDVRILITSDDRSAAFSELMLDGRDISGEHALKEGRTEVVISSGEHGKHVLSAVLRDEAGNESEPAQVRFAVVGDVPGTLLLILLAAAAGALALVRIRERKRARGNASGTRKPRNNTHSH